MHVALCHNAVIPPKKYGGTERILYWLGKALLQLGHRVTLVAREGSSVPGAQFIPYSDKDLDSVLPSDVDIIHLTGLPHPIPKKPFLITQHGNGKPNEKFHPNTVFISRSHARNHGATHFVYNGIDPDEYQSDAQREDYVVFLAKASWKVKNLKGAIHIARAAGVRLEVMGSRDWPLGLHRMLPSFRGVRYRGMVGDVEKRELLSKAKALLFPVRWPEPFGIAVVEALASGCPVLGTPYGSLPEIVVPGTGVLSANGADLIDAIQHGHFSPDRCRKRVYQGFTHLDMATHYVGYYERVLKFGTLDVSNHESGAGNPATYTALFKESPESLLPFTMRANRVT